MDSALRTHFLRCLEYDLMLTTTTGRVTLWDYIRRCWRGEPADPRSMREAMTRARVLGRRPVR